MYSRTIGRSISGSQKRIILDQGGPGLDGKEREELSHIFGRQYIRAPVRTPHQNGLAGRTVRSLRAAVRSIVQNGNRTQPSQALLTLAVVAKNHAPRAVTGLPPDFAMTGRFDITSGASTCMWEHDPMSHDSLIPQMNALRKILEARNAAIQADSQRAIRACLNHNLRDRGAQHFPIGSSVQLAVDSQWAGACRAIAHSAGNLLVGRNNKIAKRPKCKTRLSNLEDNDAMGQVHIPAEGCMWRKRRRWLAEEYPEEYRPADLTQEDTGAGSGTNADAQIPPISEEELMEIGQRALDPNDPQDPSPEDAIDVGVVRDTQQPGHGAREGNFANHGAILRERITDISP